MRVTQILTLVLSALIGAGCQSQTQTAALACSEIVDVDKVLKSDSADIIVIGEIHGMTAPPEFVSALTCQSLKAGVSTTLALELSDDEGRLKEYLSSDGSEQAKERLFEDSLWTTGFTDGRSSEAMLALIDQARVWKLQDLNFQVSFFASGKFDYSLYETRNESAAAWENHMAQNILKTANETERTIVLVGNLHARYGRGGYGGLDYEFMAEKFPADRVQTFNTLSVAGTSWNCTGQPVTCGARASGNRLSKDHTLAKDGRYRVLFPEDITVELGETSRFDPVAYDGIVFVGPAKASPPANAQNRKPLKLD